MALMTIEQRLVQGLGWLSVAMGLTLLAPAWASRLFGIGTRPLLMRVIAVRDLVIGLGLLSGRRRACWLRFHATVNAVDAIIVARGLWAGTVVPTRGLAWLIVAVGSGIFSWRQARQS